MPKKPFIALFFGLIAFILAGCAQTPRGGASEPGFANDTQGQSSGQGSTEPQDYRQVLADPGPF